MTQTYKKKLIEVAMPLEAINKNAEYEKKPGVGAHPRSLHLWWAKRPHGTARAVIFCQLVDDPSEHPDKFPKFENQEAERKRLFAIAVQLSDWKNTFNDKLLSNALDEIKKYNPQLPLLVDPFSGGGTIPIEASRMGLQTFASDLNPIPFLIANVMINWPYKFVNKKPFNGTALQKIQYSGLDGLAEDFKYYAHQIVREISNEVQDFYPKINFKGKSGQIKGEVVCWIWAKTVASPDPALNGLHVPLIKSFDLSTKKGNRFWIEPRILGNEYSFEVKSEKSGDVHNKLDGTVGRTGAKCIVSGAAIPFSYIRNEGKKGRIGNKLLAIAVKTSSKGKLYVPALQEHEEMANNIPLMPDTVSNIEIEHWSGCTNCVVYGYDSFQSLFTKRQLYVITLLIEKIIKKRGEIKNNLIINGHSKEFSELYSDALTDYLALIVSRAVDFNNMFTGWFASNEKIMHIFGRHAIPMVWDYGEANLIENVVGGLPQIVDYLAKCILTVRPNAIGSAEQIPAQEVKFNQSILVSTDPPYFDNVPYSNLSDFFYMWLRPILKKTHPKEFSTLSVPKADELVANALRHGGKEESQDFFLNGMTAAFNNLNMQHTLEYPMAIYYAFKQSEIEKEGINSRGWASFLEAIISSGLQIHATWPVRTESSLRLRARSSNALSTSVVIICRIADKDKHSQISRSEFLRYLRQELPEDLEILKKSNISPADIPQSAIGAGMKIFSRYSEILEVNDAKMTVKTALQLINEIVDNFFSDLQGEFDPETRFTITWFEQFGYKDGEFGVADNIANAKGLSVEQIKHAGIVNSSAGRLRIFKRDEISDGWSPQTDTHLTIWECCQYLIKRYEDGGDEAAAILVKKMGFEKAEAARDLAYHLYEVCSNKHQDAKEATSYNALIAGWNDIMLMANSIHDTDTTRQASLF